MKIINKKTNVQQAVCEIAGNWFTQSNHYSKSSDCHKVKDYLAATFTNRQNVARHFRPTLLIDILIFFTNSDTNQTNCAEMNVFALLKTNYNLQIPTQRQRIVPKWTFFGLLKTDYNFQTPIQIWQILTRWTLFWVA